MSTLNESHVEEAALSWFGELGYAIAHGPHMAPGESVSERNSFGDVVLVGRLRNAITRLNPTIPADAREEALRKVLRPDNPSFLANNRAFHYRLRDGVEVEYKRSDGSIAGDHVRLVDFTDVQANDSFFQALQAALAKQRSGSRKTPDQLDAAVRQLVSRAITCRVAAGLKILIYAV